MFELCDEYREFLDEGKTERECVEKSIKMAELHGFKNINSVKQLKAGDKVQLVGFGTFEVAERPEREGRNPRSGETMTIAASKNPKFKAGKALKDAINA